MPEITFPTWDDICHGCGHELEESDEEPHYLLECADPLCPYEGCHECMPMGRGSRCENCIDPETGE